MKGDPMPVVLVGVEADGPAGASVWARDKTSLGRYRQELTAFVNTIFLESTERR
jgi:hypothetical protein